jgi:hypothetical protein
MESNERSLGLWRQAWQMAKETRALEFWDGKPVEDYLHLATHLSS